MIRYSALIIIACLICSPAFSQEADSVHIIPTVDSLYTAPAQADSLIPDDTLSTTDKALKSFEERKKKFKKKEIEKRLPYFSFEDSLNTYFLFDRLNRRTSVDMSIHNDAGDYFKFDPSYFVMDYQITPMRKTVQPFGLAGNRLNIINNGMNLTPFEHIVEPDGLIDLNDIPIALDDGIYILPGGAGQIFGGKQSIASLVTIPEQLDDFESHTALVVDKGGYDYSYVRGRYNKKFTSGKSFSTSVGYRNSSGDFLFRDDDGYHYTGKTVIPLAKNKYLNASGQVYNRKSSFRVQPDFGTTGLMFRNRKDRSGRIAVEFLNDKHTSKTFLGYNYLRQNSNIDNAYKGRFDINSYDYFVGREWMKNNLMLSTKVSSNYIKYRNEFEQFERYSGDISFRLIKYNQNRKIALTIGSEYNEDYKFLPRASIWVIKDSPKFFYMFSFGYSERAPSLHELNLPFQEIILYQTAPARYGDGGNSDLASEKQLTGNITYEYGSLENNINLSITGGMIKDGIDWNNTILADTALAAFKLFRPENGDIDFADFKMEFNLKIKNYLRLLSGAAYHYLNYENFEDKAYLPDYQLFTGAELHIYWPQKYTDLFAYVELTYTDSYLGYNGSVLGQEPIINSKLGFEMKNFRFNFIWKNPLFRAYKVREDFTISSRQTYYSFTWRFFD